MTVRHPQLRRIHYLLPKVHLPPVQLHLRVLILPQLMVQCICNCVLVTNFTISVTYSNSALDNQCDRPTLIDCIRFRGRERRINIPQEIGVKYYQFGLLLLQNDTIRSIAHKHREDPERINIEVLEEWVAGKGKHPITWRTLTQVLCDIELHC